MEYRYTPEERKARMESAHAELTAAVEAISTSEDWVAFLAFAAKMHNYSANNRMWLYAQSMKRGWDDLGHVAGFHAWKSLNRSVRKGEKGLKVLAPVRYKTTDAAGEQSWAVRGFTVETVFAARQTDGEGEVPDRPHPQLLEGAGPNGAWMALSCLVATQGFKLERAELYPENGVTSFDTHTVKVADRLDEAAAVKTLAHELAHTMLHGPDKIDYHDNRSRCECEAESTAFFVMAELGLATDSYSFPYVAGWAKGDMKIVAAAADKALKCANEIVTALEAAGSLVAV